MLLTVSVSHNFIDLLIDVIFALELVVDFEIE